MKNIPIVAMWFLGYLFMKRNMEKAAVGAADRTMNKENLRETMGIDRSIYMTGKDKITLREIKRKKGELRGE